MTDELRRLPDHVTAQLLRALLCIPRAPDSRLILRPVTERRMRSGRAASRGEAMTALRQAFNMILHGPAADRA